jgi:hypothetical protein
LDRVSHFCSRSKSSYLCLPHSSNYRCKSPYCLIGWDGVLITFSPGPPQTSGLLISTSWVSEPPHLALRISFQSHLSTYPATSQANQYSYTIPSSIPSLGQRKIWCKKGSCVGFFPKYSFDEYRHRV